MTITLVIFYYFFLIVVAFFILYSLFNVYHLLRFGFASFVNIVVIIIYLLVASQLLLLSFDQLRPIDWDQPLISLSSSNSNFDL